jgi:outer membrane lipoprotein LolB
VHGHALSMTRLSSAVLLCFAVCCEISGCTSIPSSYEAVNLGPLAAYRPHFELAGRISITNGQRGESGRLRWICTKEKQELALISPLGQTVAEISQFDNQIVMLRTAGETRSAPTFDALVQDALGATVPIHDIAYWIQGVIDGQSGQATVNESDPAGRPEKLVHGGWVISIEGYRRQGAAVVATRLHAIRGDTVVKIIIDEWTALP